LDLWNFETAPVTTHEVNDSGYSNDYTGGGTLIGWYLCCFANDYTWAPGEFASSDMYENHFFDYLGFCNGDGWNPMAIPPEGDEVPVFSVPQYFSVGGSGGVNAYSDTQHFYTDHGLAD
jgi:hypothetical protein